MHLAIRDSIVTAQGQSRRGNKNSRNIGRHGQEEGCPTTAGVGKPVCHDNQAIQLVLRAVEQFAILAHPKITG